MTTWQPSPPTDPNPALVRDRLFSQLLEVERQARQEALLQADGFRKVLIRLANHMDGKEVQLLRRTTPDILQTYSAGQWFLFFETAIKRQAAPSEGTSRQPQLRELETLKAEFAQVSEQLRQAQRQIQSLQAELTQQRLKPPVPADQAKRASPPAGNRDKRSERAQNEKEKGSGAPNSFTPQVAPAPAGGKPPANTTCMVETEPVVQNQPPEFAAWQAPSCPVRYRHVLSSSEDRYRRQCKAIFLIATRGYSSRFEIDYLVSLSEGLKSRSGSLRSAIQELAERGLAVEQSLTYETRGEQGYKTSLTLIRLSAQGRDLASSLGWPPVEAEWERLLRLQENESLPSHTLGVLAFAVHARARGWQVALRPEVPGSAAPDVLVEKRAPDMAEHAGERFFVSVEMGDPEKDCRYRSLVEIQGRIAVCCGTVAQRRRIAADCRQMNLSGVATDLQTLVPKRLPVEEGDGLWLETW